jgi:hopanoid biosynthesis associated protein HpnK
MKRLIVTGDDFGLAEPVNEAIVEAHRRGILTVASLMVSGGAAGDAIERARSVPTLHVGLHLVVVEGRPVLPPQLVPDLVNTDGEFSTQLARAGFRYFFQPAAKRQLGREIRAQFEAFLGTGLALDHVNAHNHMHVHPTILSLILEIGSEYGLKAVRVPIEPPLPSWRASRKNLASRLSWWIFLWPWMQLMKTRLRRAGIRTNDFVFGMADSGRMTPELVLSFVRKLSPGVTEMYFHPAVHRCPEIDRTMPDYRHEDEFRALTSSAIQEELERQGIRKIAFSDLE